MYNRKNPYWGSFKYEGQQDNVRLTHLSYMKEPEVTICEDNDAVKRTVFSYEQPSVSVECTEQKYENAAYLHNVVTNTGAEPVKLTHISSFCYSGIPTAGKLKWYENDRFMVYHCNSSWQGEGQWRKTSITELGLIPASNHVYYNAVDFRSVGSQSTAYKYPLVMVEDTELEKTYFFELEAGCSWIIEICAVKGADGDYLCVEGSTACSLNDGWYKELEAGESYKASPAIIGVVNGGFEEAVAVLTKCRRKIQKVRYTKKPAIFNDYMDCLWALPSDKKLIPLIDRAAEVGAEVFCIDAGWFITNNNDWNSLGDWYGDDAKFGEYGFEGIIKYIQSKGMKPGVWLEIESCSKSAKAYEKFNDCLLRRNEEIIGDKRCFMDFRKQKTRDYIESIFDYLYKIGVRFIKNDYNQSTGIGVDGSDSFSEGLVEHSRAVIDFIDYIQDKYKDMHIEACASGAMRSDMAFCRGSYLQSVSDQEYYYNNPSIIVGSAACYLPEKAGIWSYPYPLPYEKREDYDGYFNSTSAFADGEETIFNMINCMSGIMYLSGHIDYADEYNLELVKEAVKIYKDTRDEFIDALPTFVSGTFRMEQKSFSAYGLRTEKSMLLSVWRINSDNDTESFDLTKWAGEDADLKLIYPAGKETEYSFENGILTIKLEKKYAARLFYVTL